MNKMEATHQLLTKGYNVLYADTDINFLKNPLSDLEKICEEGNYDVAFQVGVEQVFVLPFMLKAIQKQFICLI